MSGAGIAVYGTQNASADVTYATYFNASSSPPPDSVQPFARYTLRKGTGGVIFQAGALPYGQHRILFVNQGAEPLGKSA
jgi:hypothetical protein